MIVSYYYKSKDGKSYLCLSSPDYDNNKNYERISENEWKEHLDSLQDEEPSI